MTVASVSSSNLKTIITGTIGTVIEWAEFAFYGYMAVPIAAHFFPQSETSTYLLSTFALFAVGFLMRPLGAIIFGHIGDSIGRKQALLMSMLLMSVATFAIGCLPSYQQIGFAAPALLLVCRLLQGLAVSSECLAAAVFLIEHAGKRHPYLAGSWPGLAAALGMTLGGVAAACVTHPAAPEWAWRLPFFVGALGCVVALYLRQKVQESPEFELAKKNNALVTHPLRALRRGHALGICRTAAFAVFTGGMVYVGNMFFTTYLIEQVNFSTHDATLLTTVGELMVVLFYPLAGWLADKTDGIKMMRFGLLGIVFIAPLIFYIARFGTVTAVLFAQFLYALFDAMITAPMFKWLYDQFPTQIRVTGIAVSWNIAIAILGGTAPLIAQYSTQELGWLNGPGWYISVCALLVLVTMRRPLLREQIAVVTV